MTPESPQKPACAYCADVRRLASCERVWRPDGLWRRSWTRPCECAEGERPAERPVYRFVAPVSRE